MPPLDLEDALTAVANRVATVAAFADRVAVDRAPQGAGGWATTGGPYAVVSQTGPTVPVLGADGRTAVEVTRVAVAVWQADDGQNTDLVPDTVAVLDGWAPPGEGHRVRVFGTYRVPQPETDLLRTEIEVRYAHHRQEA